MTEETLRQELIDYYWNESEARSDAFREHCIPLMDEAYEESMSVFQMKRLQYQTISEECKPILFPHVPFYYETGVLAGISDGARDFRGHKSAAGWVYWKNAHLFRDQDPELFDLMKRQKKEKMYLICGPFNDISEHFCFNHRPILESGLKGVYEKAEKRMETANAHEKDFLRSVMDGMLAIKKIADKFALLASDALKTETDPEIRANYERIEKSASRCPWEKPANFYEALNMYAFMRKALGSLEGIGFSSFGRIDMDLYPFYEKDLLAGRITKEEAYRLVKQFLIMFDCHYNHDLKFEGYSDHELENTYVLGGCDLEGRPVFNDLTRFFLRATREEKLIYPKPKLRYSADSPKEMLDEADSILLNGASVVLYQNDDATIPAVLRTGRTIEEARDYLIFGCWGFNGNGNEKYDDGSYLNLIKPLELAVHRDYEKMDEIGMRFQPLDDAASFEELYRIIFENTCVLIKERNRITRLGGNIWYKVDVLPLFSSTLEDCIDKAKDFTEGGAKYRDDRNELFAFGNVLDSMMAMKELCFDQKKYTLKEYLQAVRDNWQGHEEMRIDATHCHGWGDGDPESTALAKRYNEDIDKFVHTLTGMYGGKITLGHLAYTEVRWWGEATRATPDGRFNREYLAQGLTPSRLKHIPNVTDVIRSLRGLDPSIFGGNTVVNIILPNTNMTLEHLEAFLRAAAKSALMSLQLNCTTKEECLDAQIHPEAHQDLIVRVTGFSAKFTSLSPDWQKEFLTRNFYE